MFDRIRQYFAARKQAEVMVNLLDMWQRNRPLAPVWDVRRFNEDGYRRNAIIFSCITEIATSLSQPPLEAYVVSGSGETTEAPGTSPLVQLINRPNPAQSRTSFLRAMSTHLEVAGNAYIYKRRSSAGLPVELYLLRPDAVRIVPGPDGQVVSYRYGADPNAQIIPAEDVIHEITNPDPLEPFMGLSPIAVLARMGDLDNFASDYLRAFFLNAGIPSGLLKYKTQVGREERERVRQIWKERYSGVKGWFDIGVIDADVEFQEIGSKLRTMDLSSVFGQTETRICSVFGVPPIMIGSWIGLQSSTYSNYDSARKSFYQDTLMPKWSSVEDRLTFGLAREFGDYYELKFDTDDIDVLQEEKTNTRTYAIDGWKSGMLTRNEAREIVGLDPLEGGDVLHATTQDVYLPADGEGSTDVAAVPPDQEVQRQMLVEFFGSNPTAWRELHLIADEAAPEVKKKLLKPSCGHRTEPD